MKRWTMAGYLAFLIAAMEIGAFAAYVYYRGGLVSAFPDRSTSPSPPVYVGLTTALAGILAEVIVLMAVSRIRQAVSPVACRLATWFLAAYVVGSLSIGAALTIAPGLLGASAFRIASAPKIFAAACLAIATSRVSRSLDRFVCLGLAFYTAVGVWSIIGIPASSGRTGAWVLFVFAAGRAMTWSLIGVWLKRGPDEFP